MAIEKRIQSEAQSLSRVTNSQLVCKDCVHVLDDSIRLGNTSTCKAFVVKPNQVLKGESCPKYLKD